MISKKSIAEFTVLFSIVLVFESFAFTAFSVYGALLGIVSGLIGFMLYVIYYNQYPKIIRQFTNFFVFLGGVSLVTGNITYGQPITAGIGANSTVFISGISLLVYYLIKRYEINIEKITKGILQVAWIILFLYTIAAITGYKVHFEEKEFGVEFLKKGIVTLASMIYLVRFFGTNRFIHFLYSVLFFSVNEWGDFQRFILFVYLASILVLVIINRKQITGFRLIVSSILAIPIAITFLYNTDSGQDMLKKLGQAYELFDRPNEDLSDTSVEARVIETEYAMSVIKRHPLFGVGRVRSKDIGKIKGNTNFYASDIGLIGIWFTFGILGLILFGKQVLYLIQFFKVRFLANPLNSSFKLFLFFLIVHTLLTGRSVLLPTEFMITVILIEAGREEFLTGKTESSAS